MRLNSSIHFSVGVIEFGELTGREEVIEPVVVIVAVVVVVVVVVVPAVVVVVEEQEAVVGVERALTVGADRGVVFVEGVPMLVVVVEGDVLITEVVMVVGFESAADPWELVLSSLRRCWNHLLTY